MKKRIVFYQGELTMKQRKYRTTRDWKSFLATSAAGISFGFFLLLAASGFAQTVRTDDEAESVKRLAGKVISLTQNENDKAQIKNAKSTAVADDKTIRPLRINIPQEALADLRRRIAATRFPDKEMSMIGRRACSSPRDDSGHDRMNRGFAFQCSFKFIGGG